MTTPTLPPLPAAVVAGHATTQPPTLREAAQAALTALEQHAMQRTYAGGVYISNAAIALRAALAQPVPDAHDEAHPLYQRGWKAGYKHGAWQGKNCAAHPQPAPVRVPAPDVLIGAMFQHQQEDNEASMAFDFNDYRSGFRAAERHYAAAHPQPAPLTDEQIADIVREASRGSAIRRDGTTSQRIARAIECHHGILPAPTTVTTGE
jgi:hypothetical protein